jgi:hypothetical protein
MTPTPNFQSKYAEERFRQAQQSFNVAIVCITACVATTFVGIGLVYNSKVGIGIVTGVAGAAPIARCVKFYREANDRLDDDKEPDDDDEENAPA